MTSLRLTGTTMMLASLPMIYYALNFGALALGFAMCLLGAVVIDQTLPEKRI